MIDAEFAREIARPLSGSADDYDGLLELIGDARFVLLAEATHGTHEFYSERAAITRRLITEKSFSILAIEADWPDSSRVHRYVRGATADANANEALSGFRRFPSWMWRNTVVLEFVEWMREFNRDIDPKRAPVGFYGMDLYSLHASIEAVLKYLEKVDPDSRFWIDLRGAGQIGVLHQRRIERAIGVIYRPEAERFSHYFHARLPEQFDAIIHIDETRAVAPLEQTSPWDAGKLPETYPFKV